MRRAGNDRLSRAVDAALELSIGGSFTRVGSALRRRLDRWDALDGVDLHGKVFVMTGATSGLGLEAARRFAKMGATLVLIARNADKAEVTCRELRHLACHDHVTFEVADMGDLDALRSAAPAILRTHPAVHVLVHNAGALDDVRQETPQGIELTVGSQVVGPVLLTELLLPALRAANGARVLWVSSGGMYGEPLRVDRLEMSADRYDGVAAYARAKRAQVTLAELYAERLAQDGVVVHAMHPGWADTPGVARSLPVFRKVVGPLLRTPAEGADTLVWLAVDEREVPARSGLFWHDRKPRPAHRLASTERADTPAERQRLWAWVRAKAQLTDTL
ncbi:MAG: SDR family NAD(P)-dependent oxidoreductase [Polyangiales bacterium]